MAILSNNNKSRDQIARKTEKPCSPMDPDVETLADDDVLAGDSGEAERLEAEAEAELLRDRLRLAVRSEERRVGKECLL